MDVSERADKVLQHAIATAPMCNCNRRKVTVSQSNSGKTAYHSKTCALCKKDKKGE